MTTVRLTITPEAYMEQLCAGDLRNNGLDMVYFANNRTKVSKYSFEK